MTDEKTAGAPASPVHSVRDEQILHYLALVADVLKHPSTPHEPKERKTFREALREPTVVAALVTVLIGGIAATLITALIQWQAGLREFDQTWLKSRGDQALISYKEYLDQEHELMRRTYALIGTCISVSDGLRDLTKSRWRRRYVGPDLEAVQKQMRDIRTNYNQTKAKWNSEGEELGLLMGYYHPGQPQVLSSWKAVKEAVTSYQECAENWSETHPATEPPPTDEAVSAACKSNYDALLKTLEDLTNSLESGRRYAWTGWESPSEIRSLIYGRGSFYRSIPTLMCRFNFLTTTQCLAVQAMMTLNLQ